MLNFSRKDLDIGNVYVYPKKGNVYTKGAIIEVVENIEQVMADVKKTVGDKVK